MARKVPFQFELNTKLTLSQQFTKVQVDYRKILHSQKSNAVTASNT